MKQAQVAVLGAGPGGYAAAFLAADLDLDVVLIDPEPNPGGVCLYRGCIPSKALLHVAKLVQETRHAKNWGLTFDEPKLDLDRLRAWKNEVVEKNTGGLGTLVEKRKVKRARGRGTFTDAHTLDVELVEGGLETWRFEHAIIATGSHPTLIPGFPDSPRVLDSTTALDLPEVPGRLLVVGGGYIGLELGSVYAALGSEVHIVEMMPTLLPGVDKDLVRPLARNIESICASVRLETKVAGVTDQGDHLLVELDNGGGQVKEKFDYVLVSVGRRPNSKGLGLEHTRVQIDEAGFIRTDLQRRTAEPSLFAIGDVAGQPMLAHKASHEGRTAVEVIAGHNVTFEPAAIPAVVFTDPEVAWAGLTETEAREQGRKVEVARFPWAASGRAATLDRSDGVTKLVVDPETERILGVGICGPGAGELIAEGVLAVEMAATVRDLDLSIHPHPTLSETVMEAAAQFFGTSSHFYKPRRK